MEIVLQKAEYDGEMMIVIPGGENCTRYCLFGDHETLWNDEKARLEYYNEHCPLTEHQKKMQIMELAQNSEIEESKTCLYIIPKWGEINEGFLNDKSVQKQERICHKGYVVQYYILGI